MFLFCFGESCRWEPETQGIFAVWSRVIAMGGWRTFRDGDKWRASMVSSTAPRLCTDDRCHQKWTCSKEAINSCHNHLRGCLESVYLHVFPEVATMICQPTYKSCSWLASIGMALGQRLLAFSWRGEQPLMWVARITGIAFWCFLFCWKLLLRFMDIHGEIAPWMIQLAHKQTWWRSHHKAAK